MFLRFLHKKKYCFLHKKKLFIKYVMHLQILWWSTTPYFFRQFSDVTSPTDKAKGALQQQKQRKYSNTC